MANKNSRNLRKQIRAAGRRGEAEVLYNKPVFNYHSQSKSAFVQQRFPTATVNGEGLISANKSLNMAMRVYHNTDENGRRASMTNHEPLNRGDFITYRNHKYMEYRQPAV